MKIEAQVYQVRVLRTEGDWSDWWPIAKPIYDHYAANLGNKTQLRVLVDQADMRKVVDALLNHCGGPGCLECGASTGQTCNDNGCGYLESGNGDPSAPVERDERAAFEDTIRANLRNEGYDDFSCDLMFERGSHGKYNSIRVEGAHEGWQARAALERKP